MPATWSVQASGSISNYVTNTGALRSGKDTVGTILLDIAMFDATYEEERL
jgi:hypothetical protein